MKKNTGKEYEEFVGSIQQILINNDCNCITNIKNINVEINKKIKDRSGIERQFDIYWEFELSGYKYKTVIECKDYATPISIEKIDAFISKVSDVPGLRPIYATKTGYQSGAEKKAKEHNIDLLIVKRPEDWDWRYINGDPLIKTIQLQILVEYPPRILEFNPFIDQNWLNDNPHIDINSFTHIKIRNDKVYILDENNKTKISVSELANILPSRIQNIQYGRGHYSEILTNSYLQLDGFEFKIKISKFELDYIYNKPIKNDTIIDLHEQLLGIVHHYTSGEQKIVFKDGLVKSL